MDVIDGNWIAQNLAGNRGEKADLSRAMGIRPEQLSKILKGERSVRPREIPAVLEFFSKDTIQNSARTAQWPNEVEQILKNGDFSGTYAKASQALAPDAPIHTVYHTLINAPWFGILEGDVIIADPKKTSKQGDLVVVTLWDNRTDKPYRLIRRLHSPWLTSSGPQSETINLQKLNGYSAKIVGPIVAIWRQL